MAQQIPNRSNDSPIWRVAFAIAHAEGFGPPDHAATLLNNPGDLSPGDEHGFAVAGPAEYHGGSYIIHFATPADGWNALYTKLANIANGESEVYSPDMTWKQFAQRYAGDSATWARNVTQYLGVTIDSRVGDSLGA